MIARDIQDRCVCIYEAPKDFIHRQLHIYHECISQVMSFLSLLYAGLCDTMRWEPYTYTFRWITVIDNLCNSLKFIRCKYQKPSGEVALIYIARISPISSVLLVLFFFNSCIFDYLSFFPIRFREKKVSDDERERERATERNGIDIGIMKKYWFS